MAEARAALARSESGRHQVDIKSAESSRADARLKEAQADRAHADLQLQYTEVRAPSDGIVSKRTVELGQIVQTGQPLLALVPLHEVWVVANFKETQLARVHPGQRAEITVDGLPGKKFVGTVHSISAGTGARFSLLPPENATGNWVKVVQRIPVKILLEEKEIGNPQPLRAGMSVSASIDLGASERRSPIERRPRAWPLTRVRSSSWRDPSTRTGAPLLESEARVVVCGDLTEEGMIGVAAEAAGILFFLKPACTERLMAACKALKVVGRYGAGLDTVDLPAASRLGIAVVHAPGSNSQSVAEHAMLLILSCAKQAQRVDRLTRAGTWGTVRARELFELKGKTLGIIGVGSIGRITARLAAAFGMRVLGYDPYVPDDELRRRGAEPVKSLDALLPQVDVLTAHTPLTPETRGMINARTLGLMKKGAVFVNTSRGPVQDERALFEALARGHLGAAGLDVFEDEPSSVDNPLFNLDNVTVSSHVAGVTAEADRTMAMQVAGEMLRVLRGEMPHVLANRDLLPRLGHLRPATR